MLLERIKVNGFSEVQVIRNSDLKERERDRGATSYSR
jgi:hypothetical protein